MLKRRRNVVAMQCWDFLTFTEGALEIGCFFGYKSSNSTNFKQNMIVAFDYFVLIRDAFPEKGIAAAGREAVRIQRVRSAKWRYMGRKGTRRRNSLGFGKQCKNLNHNWKHRGTRVLRKCFVTTLERSFDEWKRSKSARFRKGLDENIEPLRWPYITWYENHPFLSP